MLVTLGISCFTMLAGAGLTYWYYEKAIKLYKMIMGGEFNVAFIDPNNPRQLEAMMVLARGKMEMDIDKLPDPPKPHLEVVKDD